MSTDDQAEPRGAQRNRPDHVDVLASQVISVLQDRQAISLDGLRQFVLDHMVRAVLSRGVFSADAVLAELRGYRLSTDAIIDLYVPATARILGVYWEEDKINFAEVTIGSLRLQSLVSEASDTARIDFQIQQPEVNALVVVPQQEQHFLGASVLAGQLRRLGCDVAMSYDEDFGSLTTRLIAEKPDLVLITCARRETLDSVRNTVQVVRNSSAVPPTLAVGGAIKLAKEVVLELADADVVTNVAEEAVAVCVKRIKSKNPV